MFANRSAVSTFLFLFVVALSAPNVSAQTFTGDISGQVTDASGLPVAGVKVVATATATNDTFNTVTNSSGEYSIGFLKPGAYSVTFRAQGFKEIVQDALEL